MTCYGLAAVTWIRKALDLAEDALQSFQRLHCLRGEVGVGPPSFLWGESLVGRCRRTMCVAMQGNTLNDLGNDAPPSRELYEKYPPTIAGSVEFSG